MTKRAVFFDIDNTLWDEHNYIPPSAAEAIRKLRECGHVVFINSGRCRSFIRRENLLSIGFDGIVSGCGTMVEYEGEVKLYHRLDNELVALTLEVIRRYGFKPVLEGRYNLYMDEDEFTDKRYGQKLRSELGEDLLGITEETGRWEISKLSCDTRNGDR
ncbi:MAG: HAD hydrolase family protein, partial [Lachnospiraceae bacterium]|nr:HAD hydrolase family protein [Lachnospiraceae bacterium]